MASLAESEETSLPDIPQTTTTSSTRHDDEDLEMRLLHCWTSHTCTSFSPAIEYWRVQAPAVALHYRFVFEALMSLAALDLSKKEDCERWIQFDGQRK
jgi:hypothetical protein